MQEAIVAVIVSCAVWVVAKRFAPKSVQVTVRLWFASVLKILHLNAAAARLEVEAQTLASAGGCGACGGCSNGSATPAEQQSGTTVEELRRTIRR